MLVGLVVFREITYNSILLFMISIEVTGLTAMRIKSTSQISVAHVEIYRIISFYRTVIDGCLDMSTDRCYLSQSSSLSNFFFELFSLAKSFICSAGEYILT